MIREIIFRSRIAVQILSLFSIPLHAHYLPALIALVRDRQLTGITVLCVFASDDRTDSFVAGFEHLFLFRCLKNTDIILSNSILFYFYHRRAEMKIPSPSFASASAFKINFHFEQISQTEPASQLQIFLATLKSLKEDLFPYFTFVSVSAFLVTFQIIIYIFLDSSAITIKPYKGFNDILPWMLAPFAGQANWQGEETLGTGLCGMICHVLFVLIIIAELEHKLKNTSKLLTVYILSALIPSIFLHFLYQPSSALSCNNSSTYSLYGYLILHNHQTLTQQRNRAMEVQYEDSEFSYEGSRMDEGEGEEKDEKIIQLYKFIVLSYLVFVAVYGGACHFVGYLLAVVGIFVAAALNAI